MFIFQQVKLPKHEEEPSKKAQKKTVASQEKTFATAVKVCYILNFRALSYIMPPIPGFAAGAGSGAGMSVIAHSLVRMRAAILAAF